MITDSRFGKMHILNLTLTSLSTIETYLRDNKNKSMKLISLKEKASDV